MESLARHQTIKIVAPLLVPSGTEGNGANGARCHGVVVFFMRLHVLSKLDGTMFIVVNAKSSEDGTRTEGLGDAILVRKGVQPKHAEKYHFDGHPRRIFVKGGGVLVATSSFFCRANTSLDVGNMFVFPADV
jgi:hypothetical protein